jgi:multidrug efflux system membrane fusion protein
MSSAPLRDPSHHDQPALPAPEPQKALPAHATASRGSSGGILRMLLILLIVGGLIGAAVWKIHKNSTEQTTTSTRSAAAADRATPVMTVPVQQKTMPIYLTALGTVTPYNSVTVKSRVDGQLMSVDVREGQSVHKGQQLAQIDPRPYEATVAQAEGQLTKDQASAKNADAEAQRYTALYQAGVVSKESQQAQLSTAGQATGTISADEAAIQAAKVNVNYTKITSPIDGVVGLRQVDPGNIVHASDSTGLLLVTQLQPITVIFTIPEDQLPEVLKLVRGGQKLAVEASDRSQTTKLASGTLLTLDNTIDPTTGTVKVKAVFPNKDGALFPNQFVNIRLILQQRQNALVVPAAALQTGSEGSFVFVVKQGNPPKAAGNTGGGGKGGGGGKKAGGGAAPAGDADAGATGASAAPKTPPAYVVTQPVKVDLTEGTQVILASGVNPGDQVVTDGQEKLVNYSKVSPKTQDAPIRHVSNGDPATGPGTAAFGPGGAGPSDAPSHPHKQGLEEGKGRPAGSHTSVDPAPDGQPHPHRNHTPPGSHP